MKKILMCGGIGFSVAELLKQLEYEIVIPSGESLCKQLNKDDGWYRKFDKISKKRNLKRG